MWPPGLEDDTVMDLRDSFPHGKVPPLTPVASKEQEEPLRWSNLLSKQSNRLPLLRRAARSQEDEEQRLSEEVDGKTVPQLLMLAATLLVTVRHLQPVDYLLVTAVTGYLVVLQKLAAQQRQRTTSASKSSNLLVPVLPALPPQGHVPVTNQTPLGYALTQSRDYRRWLRLGEVVGWWAPMLLMLVGTTQLASATTTVPQSLVARPLFLLAAQAVTERRVTRRWTTPLPIRILVPVLYNWIRLGYLWKWATTSVVATTAITTSTTLLPFRSISQWLAVANWAYTAVNLWGFLIPVATLRYLRAHFWGVEAARVVTRRGLGLLMDDDE